MHSTYKYFVRCGVSHKWDKDKCTRKLISPFEIIRKHGVDEREVFLYDPAPWWPSSYYKMADETMKGLIELKEIE